MSLVFRGSVLALVVGVVSCGGASETTTPAAGSATTAVAIVTPTSVNTPNCATGGACAVGDTGPGGGIVFYVSATVINTVAGVSAGGRYLEAAPNTWNGGTSDPPAEWGCNETIISGADGTEVGSGAQNTKDIDTGCTTFGIAADRAINLVFGGQSDWFLPSRDELGLILTDPNLFAKHVGGFIADFYWSSSELDADTAWGQVFSIDEMGGNAQGLKSYQTPFRPIRAFGTDTSNTGVVDTASTLVMTLTCATGGNCKVGDTGPGGGVVFYVSGRVSNTVEGVSAGGHYLEAAPITWNGGKSDPVAEWGCDGSLIDGAAGTKIGTGAQNTKDIVIACTTSGIAADMAISLVFGGQSDWFLPSRDELNLMYTNLFVRNLGGFEIALYWSSTEFDADYARFRFFDAGSAIGARKGDNGTVRPVRAFG